MTYLEKQQARHKEILAELRKIQNKVSDENREMPAEERTSFNALEKEYDVVSESITRETRLNERESAAGGRYESAPAVENRGKSGDGEEDRSKESKKSSGPFKSFGEQLQQVIRAGSHGGRVDPRLLEVRAATGMNEVNPAEGGFLVQKEYSEKLSTGAYDTGVLSSRCTRLPIGAGKNGIKLTMIDETSRVDGSRQGGVLAYWAGEAEQKTKSKPKLRQIELTLKKLIGLIPITDELLEDATALESWVNQLFSKEFGFQIDNAIVRGSGVGQPLGFLNSPALVTQDDEATQAAAVINWKNIVKMYSRLPAASASKAAWYYNSEIFPALATMQFDAGATSGSVPLFIPANSAAGNPQNSLLGLPLIPIEQASALGTPGDLILADMSEYLLIEKGGIQSAMSIHVRFEYDESMLRFVFRTDGQPMWRAPLTPFLGTATKSPFVVLDTRNGS